jgi:signal transduction histidine kinase
MPLTLKLSHKGLILVLVPLVFGLGCFAFLYAALSDAEAAAKKEEHFRLLSEQVNELSRDEFDLTDELYKFYRDYDSDDGYRNLRKRQLETALNRVLEQFSKIHTMMADSPEDVVALSRVERKAMAPFGAIEAQERSGKRNRMKIAMIMMAELQHQSKISRDFGILTNRYIEQEERAFQIQVQRRRQLKQALQLAIMINILLSVALYFYFNRHTAKRLLRLLNNTVLFANNQPLHSPLQGDDEIARLDVAFRQMAQSITAVVKNKQEFMIMLARDIRSPLNSINDSLQQLSSGLLSKSVSATASSTVVRCLDSNATLMRLIDDLLDIGGVESGKLQMNFQQVPIGSVLVRAHKSLQGLAEAKSIKIMVQPTQAVVYGDGDRLVQVVINLLANAVKFSSDGSTVRLEVLEHHGWLRLKVIDDGPGIARDKQSHVFERFHQIGSADRRTSGGTGLGLTICREIVDAHHGLIGVESAEGKGCTFWIEVPMTKSVMNSPSGSSTMVRASAPEQSPRLARGNSQFKLKLTQKALILLGVPLAFGVASFGLLYGAVTHAEGIAREEAFAKSVNNHRTMLFQRALEASSVLMEAMSGNAGEQDAFRTAVQRMHDELQTLHDLVAHDRYGERLLRIVQNSIMEPFDRLSQEAPDAQARNVSELFAKPFPFNELKSVLEPYRQLAESSFQRQAADTRLLKVGLFGAITINIFLSFGLYIVFTRDTSGRLDIVLDNTLRFGRGESLTPELTGNDEIARLDNVFHEMTTAITRAANEKKEFMAMIAHDIRSPLSSIVTSLTLLCAHGTKADVSEAVHRILEHCIESSERVLQLINDLLDIEKFDAGKLEMQFEDLPIAYVLETAKNSVRDFAHQKHVKMNVPSSDAEVHGDPNRLVQVLTNLLFNSVENSQEGRTVTVVLEDEAAWLTLCVTDAVDIANSARAGLGWSICEHIVAAHHGTIGVERTHGEERTDGKERTHGEERTVRLRLPKTDAASR